MNLLRKEILPESYLIKPKTRYNGKNTATTGYNKALRKHKRYSWRKHCEEIEQNSLYGTTVHDEWWQLYKIHVLGVRTIHRSPETWINAKPIPPIRASNEEWQVSKKLHVEKVKWVINSFLPYKNPSLDDLYPVMLQKGNRPFSAQNLSYISLVESS